MIHTTTLRSRFLVHSMATALAVSFLPSLMAEEEEVIPHVFRVLPLGDHPPFRQEVRDGVRYEIDPPEGSVPPPKVEVATGGDSGVAIEGKLLPFRLRLGSPSVARRVKVGDVRSVGLIDEEGEEWARLPLAKGDRSLVVAWRTEEGDWSEPRFAPLGDGPAAVPPGSVRFFNASRTPVGLQWGNEKLGLKPGKLLVREFPEGAARVVLMVLYPGDDGEFRQVFSNVVDRDAGKMHQFFIYQTDGEGARGPVRVVPLIEDRKALVMPVVKDQES